MLIVFIADLLRAFNKLMYTVDLLGGGGWVCVVQPFPSPIVPTPRS